MAEQPQDAGQRPPTTTPHRRPRWVTITWIIVAVLLVLFVILQLTGVGPGAGGHGPGRHRGSAAPPATVTADRG